MRLKLRAWSLQRPVLHATYVTYAAGLSVIAPDGCMRMVWESHPYDGTGRGCSHASEALSLARAMRAFLEREGWA